MKLTLSNSKVIYYLTKFKIAYDKAKKYIDTDFLDWCFDFARQSVICGESNLEEYEVFDFVSDNPKAVKYYDKYMESVYKLLCNIDKEDLERLPRYEKIKR